mmetsp:Transcript_21938/g.47728  ORF Transcript_21938/g.47728 Transcript_21938/m.47728 type:complete len:109 (-) Transcript_21938:71-397(-)
MVMTISNQSNLLPAKTIIPTVPNGQTEENALPIQSTCSFTVPRDADNVLPPVWESPQSQPTIMTTTITTMDSHDHDINEGSDDSPTTSSNPARTIIQVVPNGPRRENA